ncbi:MAG: hypothetical protein RL651_1356 [Pseudomonadota bacterium]|jgi:uncharacterized protein YdiU (UPF0061 family)
MGQALGLNGCGLKLSYTSLPAVFHSNLTPQPVRAPVLKVLNTALAQSLGLDPAALATPDNISLLAGNVFLPNQTAIAQAYAGHQFGGFAILGDGRALLLGELPTPEGQVVDIQLKGSGPTPYARRGDGRAALGPMLREYLISEAMHGLGIPTTRSLAVVATGEPVFRETAQPGAILTRIAASHIRVGTFEFAATQGAEELKALADYAIDRHYPQVRDEANPYLAFLKAVIDRQAALIARWMQVGFVHGVMNTDNMSIAGETIDYGPCAFMERYDPSTVFSSIDRQGRYAYGNQPRIAQWNLSRLAEALLPILNEDEATALELAQSAIGDLPGLYQHYWHTALCQKIGITNPDRNAVRLGGELLDLMWEAQADFTNTFHQLTTGTLNDECYADWLNRWHAIIDAQPGGLSQTQEMMQQANPVIIPRNHLVQEALDTAEEKGSFTRFEQLVAALQNPYDPALVDTIFAKAPPASTAPYVTYCGT